MPVAASPVRFQRPTNISQDGSIPIGKCRERAREGLHDRTRRLLKAEIGFIPNRTFKVIHVQEQVEQDRSMLESETPWEMPPDDLPGHLARLCQCRLLSAEEEKRLFRRMNFLKFKANSIRVQLNERRPDEQLITRVEKLLMEATAIRDRIVQANLRLVVSVVKKYVTPQHSFDDLLSDGIISLMQAVEKFDYDRGFRFSTYAYRAIWRNSFRKISNEQKEAARFTDGNDADFDAADRSSSSADHEDAWETLRELLADTLPRLDRREKFILRGRYALSAHRKVRSFQCLADKLGISKERVRQLEQRAIAKLKKFVAEYSLDDVLGRAFG